MCHPHPNETHVPHLGLRPTITPPTSFSPSTPVPSHTQQIVPPPFPRPPAAHLFPTHSLSLLSRSPPPPPLFLTIFRCRISSAVQPRTQWAASNPPSRRPPTPQRIPPPPPVMPQRPARLPRRMRRAMSPPRPLTPPLLA
ncbi:unnamed protein product [Chondrus crispus]|uniref:Uncharacterized protein n=1 Tax=Chondrus crispus TaxID=2769 RepID=R7QAT5_CHOCR|nr:unnamed protein product [Chondrus crispus]CDF34570.1 unnamed protein product [Chondrus crispus]|eukprot:XP_005714389.1 unnamed protein product [Chondrus crispus]